jgi:Flp pilus assembly protein TadG
MHGRFVVSPSRPSRSKLSALRTSVAAFRRDERGTMAVLGAFALLLGCVAVGAAMDYSRASSSDSKFQQAADAAVLSAAIAVQKDMMANERKRDSEYEEAAHEVFLANLDEEGRAQVTGKDLQFVNGRKQAKYTYTAEVTFAFGGLVGSSASIIGGEAVAALPGAGGMKVADIHLLVDTSASMGLAADPDGRKRMKEGIRDDASMGDADRAATKRDPQYAQKGAGFEGCAFACHTPRGNVWYFGIGQTMNGQYIYNWWSKAAEVSTYEWARNNNVKLRIDVAKEALAQVLQDALNANQASSSDVQFSLSTFHDRYYSLTSGGTFRLRPTDKLSDVKTKAALLELGYPNKSTPKGESVAEQPNTLPDSSDGFELFADDVDDWRGSTEAKGRDQYVILITDGVRSVVHGSPAKGEVRPFDQADCGKIKTVARLAVLYTRYLEPLPTEDTTMAKGLGNIYPQIEPNMKACASDPSLFAMADSSTEITQALKSLFGNIQSEVDAGNLRLTQ